MVRRVKIPKKFNKLDGEKIQLRYALSPFDEVTGKLPSYEIRSLSGSGRDAPLGFVSVYGSKTKNGRDAYSRENWFDVPGENNTEIGKKEDLADAIRFAYRTAVDIAKRIAEKNRLPLEDLAIDDQHKIEGEELAIRIDALKPAVSFLFIAGGLILSLSSLTITGNAVSNVTGTAPGLLGIILFIAGLVGMFFYFKKK